MMQEQNVTELPRATLLFVDDEQNILSSLKRLFRSEGYNIVLANSGIEGLEILNTQKVDLVISDMRMPEMNGAEFLEKVAKSWPKTTRILLTGYSEISATIDAVNKGNIYKYISKPWEDNDIKLTVRYALEAQKIEQERDDLLALTSKQNEELKQFNTNLEGLVKARTAELDQTMAMLEKAYETLKDSYSATIKIFSNIMEIREKDLIGNSHLVSEKAKEIALLMGMEEDQALQVSFAGMLRNIGKIGFDDQLIKKPVEVMSKEERIRYEKHPVIAEGVLMTLQPLSSAARMIRHYCEKYDGSGYPDKLKNDDIPIGSRILSVVNDYYALQDGILLGKRMSSIEAFNYIKVNSGIRYSPKVVDVFISSVHGEDENNKYLDEIEAATSELEAGMILTRDLKTNDGIVLLVKDVKLGKHVINQIINLESRLNEKFKVFVTR
ncbi:MAG: response regulator [Gammaproteobacteria bacterium]|nr:response regulator [Gammaproteobacteria bacterium]MDH5735899.1 response regulator [Gammaproteobacteria bacterium]